MTNLNWDMVNTNGIILNKTYTSPCLFSGVTRKPILPSGDYRQFIYQETTNTFLFQGLSDADYRPMTSTEKAEILTVAANWKQLPGEPGNPNADQVAESKVKELRDIFSANTMGVMNPAEPYEPVTWRTQEAEARAWTLDNTTPTPAIDALIAGRGLNEPKAAFIAKVIVKADAYMFYYGLLGKLQVLLKQVETFRIAQDIAGIQGIIW